MDQIGVHDPVLESLSALSSRLELVERLLDRQYYADYHGAPQGEPEEIYHEGDEDNVSVQFRHPSER